MVNLVPMGFTLAAYEFAIEGGRFLTAFWVSVQRVILGVGITMVLLITTAYPLSKSKQRFAARHIYMAFYVTIMIFQGGVIPFYILIRDLGMMDTMWSLVLPGSVQVFSMVILMNFIRSLPSELEEAAMIDGAGHWKTLVLVYLPVLKPALAVVALFAFVRHWNAWWDGMMFMNRAENWPLQTYLRHMINFFRDLMREGGGHAHHLIGQMNEQTGRSAQLFMSLVPTLIVYPFLQKHFTKGLIMGSVKG
jgi:putative aldouronate transport system permease protein